MVVKVLDRARLQAPSLHELRGDAIHAGPRIHEDRSSPVIDDRCSDVSWIEPAHSCVFIPICGGRRVGNFSVPGLGQIGLGRIRLGDAGSLHSSTPILV